MPVVLTRKVQTVADLVYQLGDIPLERIRMNPLPGTAKEADLLALSVGPKKRLFELVDGTLVEKVMGAWEGHLALILGQFLCNFLDKNDLGLAFGADSPFRILPRRVRLPDLSFVRWEKFANQKKPSEKILTLIPDLAIEIISEGNTKKEMQRKLVEYFKVGVLQVWLVYPKTRTAKIYTAPNRLTHIASDQSLTGGEILPGFELPLAKLFAGMDKLKRKKKK